MTIEFFFITSRIEKKDIQRSPENHWFAGPVVAINKGLEFIESDWIARIDDDDIWTEDHLENCWISQLKINLSLFQALILSKKKMKKL